MQPSFNLIGVLTVLACAALDAACQLIATNIGYDTPNVQLIAWGAAVALLTLLWSRPLVSENLGGRPPWWWMLTVSIVALSARAAVLTIYQGSVEVEFLQVLAGTATGLAVMWFGFAPYARVEADNRGPSLILDGACVAFIVLSILGLRLLYAPLLELLSEEAYYWKYAEQLDYGYLDHPPVVAFLIAAGQALLGISELGVRVMASLCWLVMAYFIARLTSEWFEPKAAKGALLLLAILPLFAAVGLYMTPDAPLMACWAATLFFLHRALLRQQRWAWYALGISIGLGLLSKYPMVLIGPAIVACMLLDRDSRRWFLRPEPYSAALIAFLVFSPVLFWNSTHEWASFAFQGPRRFKAAPEFSVHLFLAFFIALLTPVGAWLAALFFLPRRWREWWSLHSLLDVNRRVRIFILCMSGAPLAVFFYASLSQEIKVNWLAPALLVLVPALAESLSYRRGLTSEAERGLQRLQRGWVATVIILVSVVSVFFYYVGVGVTGVRYPRAFKKFMGWESLTQQVIAIEQQVKSETGMQPVVIGADSHYVASELGFYRAKSAFEAEQHLPPSTQGRHLLGGAYSLMYYFWSDAKGASGRPVIMASRTRSDVEESAVAPYFSRLGEVQEIMVSAKGEPLGTFYVRVGYDYKPSFSTTSIPKLSSEAERQ